MRILHYIHKQKANDLLSDYLDHLVNGLQGQAEVYVATRDSDIQEMLDTRNPDIIHIHSCWDRYAYQLMRSARKQGFAVVLSPHNEIGTYAMKHEHRTDKCIKLADYQRWMISNSEALLATSTDERDALLALGWQKRIDVVLPSILNSSLSDEEMGRQMVAFYGKVIDTRYRVLMSDSEKEAVRSLIHVGMAHNETMALLDSDRILTLRGLKPVQWRHILLYGDDEDLREIIDAAAERMQLSIPAIDTSKISRYPTEKPKAMGELPGDRLMGKNKLQVRNLQGIIGNDSAELQQLVTMFINARTLLRKRQMSMRHLAELYDHVKYDDYDETRFVEMTKELKLRPFMRHMLSVMAQEAYLEEGFMPDKPLSDAITKNILTQFI